MADQKLTALTEVTALDDDDLMYSAVDPAGTPLPRKIKKKNVLRGVEAVTTGASPVDANIEAMITNVTTGGTAGTEDLNLPLPTGPEGYIGLLHLVVIQTLTDPADNVQITSSGIIEASVTLGEFGLALYELLNTVNGPNWVLRTSGGIVSPFSDVLIETITADGQSQLLGLGSALGSVEVGSPWLFYATDAGTTAGFISRPPSDSATRYNINTAIDTVIPADRYQVRLTSDGSASVVNVTANDGADANIGVSGTIYMNELENPSDTISIDPTNFRLSGSAPASIVLTTQGQMIVRRWDIDESSIGNGYWNIIQASAGVVTP